MRRLVLILLMLTLAFQWNWAAAAAYCVHETGSQAQHLGHHQHEHQDRADATPSDNPADGKALGGVDTDCDHCHGHSVTALPMAPSLLTSPAVGACTPGAVADLPGSALSRPERPQWASLA